MPATSTFENQQSVGSLLNRSAAVCGPDIHLYVVPRSMPIAGELILARTLMCVLPRCKLS